MCAAKRLSRTGHQIFEGAAPIRKGGIDFGLRSFSRGVRVRLDWVGLMNGDCTFFGIIFGSGAAVFWLCWDAWELEGGCSRLDYLEIRAAF